MFEVNLQEDGFLNQEVANKPIQAPMTTARSQIEQKFSEALVQDSVQDLTVMVPAQRAEQRIVLVPAAVPAQRVEQQIVLVPAAEVQTIAKTNRPAIGVAVF